MVACLMAITLENIFGLKVTFLYFSVIANSKKTQMFSYFSESSDMYSRGKSGNMRKHRNKL